MKLFTTKTVVGLHALKLCSDETVSDPVLTNPSRLLTGAHKMVTAVQHRHYYEAS